MATTLAQVHANTETTYKAMKDYRTTVVNDPVKFALWAKAVALMSSCSKTFG